MTLYLLTRVPPALGFEPAGVDLRLAPWWLSGWLLILAALAGLGLAVFWLQWRLRWLMRRNLKLEEEGRATAEALARAGQALEAASLVDAVTGLHNRKFLEPNLANDAQQAQRAFKDMLAAGRDPLAAREDLLLFLLDLDYFKHINETWGRAAGDAVLAQLAQRLKTITRKTDFRVRWDEGTFLLVARRARRSGAVQVARKLMEDVRDLTFQLPEGATLRERLSIGFSAFPPHPCHPDLGTWQQALGLAEQCLAAAKGSGRDRWVGALLEPGADPAPLRGQDRWNLPWAVARGLIRVDCSEPGLVWPS